MLRNRHGDLAFLGGHVCVHVLDMQRSLAFPDRIWIRHRVITDMVSVITDYDRDARVSNRRTGLPFPSFPLPFLSLSIPLPFLCCLVPRTWARSWAPAWAPAPLGCRRPRTRPTPSRPPGPTWAAPARRAAPPSNWTRCWRRVIRTGRCGSAMMGQMMGHARFCRSSRPGIPSVLG